MKCYVPAAVAMLLAVAPPLFAQSIPLKIPSPTPSPQAGETVAGRITHVDTKAATLAAEHVMRAGMDFLEGLNSGGETPLLLLAEYKNKQRGEPRTARAAQRADRKRIDSELRQHVPAVSVRQRAVDHGNRRPGWRRRLGSGRHHFYRSGGCRRHSGAAAAIPGRPHPHTQFRLAAR